MTISEENAHGIDRVETLPARIGDLAVRSVRGRAGHVHPAGRTGHEPRIDRRGPSVDEYAKRFPALAGIRLARVVIQRRCTVGMAQLLLDMMHRRARFKQFSRQCAVPFFDTS